MNNQQLDKIGSANTDVTVRPDLDAEEYRDGAFYKPISVREYFKLLRYCITGFIVILICLSLFSAFAS